MRAFLQDHRKHHKELCMDAAATLSAVHIGFPLYMVLSYRAIISICLLLSRTQLSLAVSFLYVSYFGYFCKRALFLDAVRGALPLVH
jgi:hypothetical protein